MSMQNTVYSCIIIIVLFSVRTTVNLLLPHPVLNTQETFGKEKLPAWPEWARSGRVSGAGGIGAGY